MGGAQDIYYIVASFVAVGTLAVGVLTYLHKRELKRKRASEPAEPASVLSAESDVDEETLVEEHQFVLGPGDEETIEVTLEAGDQLLARMSSDSPVDFLLVGERSYRRSRRNGNYTYEKGGEARIACNFAYLAPADAKWLLVVVNEGDDVAEVEVVYSVTPP